MFLTEYAFGYRKLELNKNKICCSGSHSKTEDLKEQKYLVGLNYNFYGKKNLKHYFVFLLVYGKKTDKTKHAITLLSNSEE